MTYNMSVQELKLSLSNLLILYYNTLHCLMYLGCIFSRGGLHAKYKTKTKTQQNSMTVLAGRTRAVQTCYFSYACPFLVMATGDFVLVNHKQNW